MTTSTSRPEPRRPLEILLGGSGRTEWGGKGPGGTPGGRGVEQCDSQAVPNQSPLAPSFSPFIVTS